MGNAKTDALVIWLDMLCNIKGETFFRKNRLTAYGKHVHSLSRFFFGAGMPGFPFSYFDTSITIALNGDSLMGVCSSLITILCRVVGASQ